MTRVEIDFDQVAAELTPKGKAELITPDSARAAEVALVYDGDVDPPKDLGAELDQLMTRRLAV